LRNDIKHSGYKKKDTKAEKFEDELNELVD